MNAQYLPVMVSVNDQDLTILSMDELTVLYKTACKKQWGQVAANCTDEFATRWGIGFPLVFEWLVAV